jgi:hypothetical protein
MIAGSKEEFDMFQSDINNFNADYNKYFKDVYNTEQNDDEKIRNQISENQKD